MPLTVEQITARIRELHEHAEGWCADSDEEMNWYQGQARVLGELLDWIKEQNG